MIGAQELVTQTERLVRHTRRLSELPLREPGAEFTEAELAAERLRLAAALSPEAATESPSDWAVPVLDRPRFGRLDQVPSATAPDRISAGTAVDHSAHLPRLVDTGFEWPSLLDDATDEVHIANEALLDVVDPHGELLFEVELSTNGIRPKWLRVWENALSWGSLEVPFDKVQNFSYEVFKHRTALVPAHTGYVITLWTEGRAHIIEIVASNFSQRSTKASIELLFESLVSLLHDRVGARLIEGIVDRLRGGETIAFRGVSLHRSGVTCKRGPASRTYDWDEIAGAEFSAGNVVIHRVFRQDSTRPCGKVAMGEAGAVLLVDLLHEGVDAFSRRAQTRRRRMREVFGPAEGSMFAAPSLAC